MDWYSKVSVAILMRYRARKPALGVAESETMRVAARDYLAHRLNYSTKCAHMRVKLPGSPYQKYQPRYQLNGSDKIQLPVIK
jgi:hypothetical protein